jgi:HTH-type transcriptional regulator/antitoxin HigA
MTEQLHGEPLQPDWVSPPGETVEDLLEERRWTQAELAERTGLTRKHINDLLHGRAHSATSPVSTWPRTT